MEIGLTIGWNGWFNAATEYHKEDALCGLPRVASDSGGADEITVIALDLKMMVDDGMIWWKGSAGGAGRARGAPLYFTTGLWDYPSVLHPSGVQPGRQEG